MGSFRDRTRKKKERKKKSDYRASRCWGQAPQWESVSVEQLIRIAWLCHATEWQVSQRVMTAATRPSTNGKGGGAGQGHTRHCVAKATSAEWVRSWNAARRQLYNSVRVGAVRAKWRGERREKAREKERGRKRNRGILSMLHLFI